MISNYHHVELNGVPYRLAEGVEGEHYSEGGEPLRPPNNQVVQGATQTLFQMRPDTLVWLIDSWAGGSGQFKYDPENPDRMRLLYNVDALTQPGKLKQGWEPQEPTHGGLVSPESRVVRFYENLYMFNDTNTSDTGALLWNQANIRWGTGYTGTSGNAYTNYIHAITNPASAHRILLLYSGSPGFTLTSGAAMSFASWSSTFPITTTDEAPIILGDYFYAIDDGEHIIELLATGSGPAAAAPTTVYTWNGYATTFSSEMYLRGLIAAENKGFFFASTGGGTQVFQLTPTTAAGAAFASPIFFLKGVYLTGMAYAAGVLFMLTESNEVYYYQPGGSYGIVKAVDEEGLLGGKLFRAFSKQEIQFDGRLLYWIEDGGTWGGFQSYYLFALDIVSGAWQIVSSWSSGGTFLMGAEGPQAASHPRHRVWAVDYDSDRYLYFDNENADVRRTVSAGDHAGGFALTPWHGFGVADAKQLMSVRVKHDMTDDWQLQVVAFRNGDDSTGTVLSTITGTGGPSSTTIIPSSAYAFGLLALKLRFLPGAAADPADIPEITAVEVRATVLQQQKMWRLILDCADDVSGAVPGYSGAVKLNNVRTLAATSAPFTFKDGYLHRDVGEFNTHTVVVDSYRLVPEKAGEGTAEVILREQS